jgi:cyclophilin family peptidyl-prolyl cis-trans isomerase
MHDSQTGQPTGQFVEVRENIGRIVFKLFDKENPITASNFRQLSTGQRGYGYAGTRIHRVVPNFIIQGGYYTMPDGTVGKAADGSVLQRMYALDNLIHNLTFQRKIYTGVI